MTVTFNGVRTTRYKYVEYVNRECELLRDPDEPTNQVRNPAFASIRASLAARLRAFGVAGHPVGPSDSDSGRW